MQTYFVAKSLQEMAWMYEYFEAKELVQPVYSGSNLVARVSLDEVDYYRYKVWRDNR